MPLPKIGQELLDVPFPQMIKSMGLAISEAQFSLDQSGVRLAQMMSGKYELEEPDPTDDDPYKTKTVTKEAYVRFNGEDLSLLELGFTPTFYQFVDTIIEVKISISMSSMQEFHHATSSTKASGGGFALPGFGGFSMSASSVSASYASKYQYSAEGSSLMRTKLVPVPPPAVLEERIRRVIDQKLGKPPAA
jgi:hypothetical protein